MFFYTCFIAFVIIISSLFRFMNPIVVRVYGERREIKDTLYLCVVGFFFILLSGLRSFSVGTDTSAYKNIFEYLGSAGLFESLSSNESRFIGYRLLCKAVYLLVGPNYHVFLLIVSFITIFCIFRFIKNVSSDVYLSVILFVLTYTLFRSWNAHRQYLAIALGMNCVWECYRGKRLKSVFYYVLAVLFHNPAIVLAVVYAIKEVHWNKKRYLCFTGLLLICVSVGNYLINLFFTIFPSYAVLYAQNLSDGNMDQFGGVAQGRKAIVSLFFLAIVLVTLWLGQKDKMEIGVISTWSLMALVMVEIVIGIFFLHNSMLLRVQQYFSIFSICAVPNMVQTFKLNNTKKMIVRLAICMIMVIPCAMQLLSNNSGIVPYSFM